MNRYKVELPDKRVMTIEAPDEQTALADADAWFAQKPAGPQTSATGALLTGIGQGLFGLGDEAEAAIRVGLDPNKTYEETLSEVRERVAASAEQHPYAYYGGEIGSAVAMPFGAAKAGLSLIDKAVKAGKGLKGVAGASALEGAAYGGASGFGRGEGGLQQRVESAVPGAALGGAIGGAAPLVIGGASAGVDAVRRNVRTVTDPMGSAADDVARTLIDDDRLADVARGMQGKPMRIGDNATAARMYADGKADTVRLVDTGGEKTRALMRAAANNSPEAREVAQSTLMPRAQGQATRAVDFIKSITGRTGNAYQAGQDLAKKKAANLDPLYRVARELGDRPIWNRNLEALTGSKTVQQAMQDAAKVVDDRAVSQGYGAMNAGVSFENGVMRFTRGADNRAALPNLEFWDQTKRILDDAVRNARGTRDMDKASRLGEVAKRLRKELDASVPQYKTARGVAAQFFDAEDALEAGQKMAARGTKFDTDEAAATLSKMTPEERGLFEEGFVSSYLKNIEGSPDNANLVNRLMNSQRDRKMFEIALGPDKTNQLEAFLHIEGVQQLAVNALGNSTTTRQLIEQGLLAGGGGLLVSGGNPLDPSAWITAALIKWAPSKVGGVVKERYARNVVQLLMSRESDAVAKAVGELSKPNNMAALRKLTKAMVGAGAAVGANMTAQTAPLTGSQMGQHEGNR